MVIERSALIQGIGLYLLLYGVHVGVLPWLVGESAANSDNQAALYLLNQALGITTCLLPGYIAARKAGHHGFIHGGLVGGVSTILTALIAMLWAVITGARFSGLATIPFWVLTNAFLAAFAGIMATNLKETSGSSDA